MKFSAASAASASCLIATRGLSAQTSVVRVSFSAAAAHCIGWPFRVAGA